MKYTIKPITRNAATTWMKDVHRHLKRPVTGWLFGIQLLDADGKRVGVAMAGRPTARMLQDGETIEITRVAVLEGHPNACSRVYGALRKAALALGYTRVITYTLEEETGHSPAAAGFRCEGTAGGGQADRPSRRRKPVEQAGLKVRWVYP